MQILHILKQILHILKVKAQKKGTYSQKIRALIRRNSLLQWYLWVLNSQRQIFLREVEHRKSKWRPSPNA